jgi:hypothetical protein
VARGRKRKAWSHTYGQRPDTVTAREKYVGGNLYLRSRADADVPLGFKVRGPDGELDPTAEREARRVAEDRNLELRLERQRGVAEPQRLTVGEALALFRDPVRGAMPRSRSGKKMYTRLLGRWEAFLKPATPWQQVYPKDVRALLRVLREGEGHPTEAEHALKILGRVYRWLDGSAGYEGIRNPTKGIPLKEALGEDYRPNKPRYTAAEARRLVETRHDPRLDPRWALFLALMDDSGKRGVSIRHLWRSDLNKPLQDPVPEGAAPYGWIWFSGRKGQKGAPHPLTDFERREIDLALSTWLADLEDAHQRGEIADYLLIPGEYFPEAGRFQPHHAGVRAPISYQTTKDWLRKAEGVADVPYVKGRGLHGLRRAWVDVTRAALGIEGAQFAGDWSSRSTVEGYAEEVKWDVRDAARQVHEKKREPKEGE